MALGEAGSVALSPEIARQFLQRGLNEHRRKGSTNQ
jgi:hypothetical protein